jgi:hypothetical protein
MSDEINYPIGEPERHRIYNDMIHELFPDLPNVESRILGCLGTGARNRNDSLSQDPFLASVPGFVVGSHSAYWKPALKGAQMGSIPKYSPVVVTINHPR